ncbi:hypothetical protein E2C01_031236 [Portunus trituberculatus]|uniref:Uncharacterized protein n=1 Tax=Portunus trituberculatus TaxID=210409 RepID=A0A5B7EX28_PORTR|nr:hypothetical protein [Portunus trituberculatus]
MLHRGVSEKHALLWPPLFWDALFLKACEDCTQARHFPAACVYFESQERQPSRGGGRCTTPPPQAASPATTPRPAAMPPPNPNPTTPDLKQRVVPLTVLDTLHCLAHGEALILLNIL